MKPNCAFTICAKNYLAQALTLRKSVNEHNDIDFFIFLADKFDEEVNNKKINNIVELNNNWIKEWEIMAFKYNVIEFSTAIKPFAFKKLFSIGYNKVIYLDPDTYVTSSLDKIFYELNKYSCIITPHYNNIQINFSGSVPEEELLFVGIYNLGFIGIKNDKVGKEIIEWWENRLFNKCYADKEDALHVDQKWIDFLPAFFPENIKISHHPGINIAIWNIHERELLLENNKYYVKDKVTNKIYELIFFHFSGFDPNQKEIINKRHPNFSTKNFPSYIKLIEEYRTKILNNDYRKYKIKDYEFNSFEDGTNILPIHRRLYRQYELENRNIKKENPFLINSEFYNLLKSKNLLTKKKSKEFNAGITESEKSQKAKFDRIAKKLAKLFIKLFGIRNFYILLKYLYKFSRFEYHTYLIKK